jgi:D-sedoheptulose 7-phosphate isomerase
MTMIVNDYGVENMYSKFIEYTHSKDSLVILISSSGNSQNIINANFTASDLGLGIITLTGFDRNNKLSSLSRGSLDIWVDSRSYGVVEMAHHSILHSVV